MPYRTAQIHIIKLRAVHHGLHVFYLFILYFPPGTFYPAMHMLN